MTNACKLITTPELKYKDGSGQGAASEEATASIAGARMRSPLGWKKKKAQVPTPDMRKGTHLWKASGSIRDERENGNKRASDRKS